jgi:hypothetical protein
MDILEKARLHHEKLMREDPKYREEWEKINAIVMTFIADAEIEDKKDKT